VFLSGRVKVLKRFWDVGARRGRRRHGVGLWGAGGVAFLMLQEAGTLYSSGFSAM